MLRITVTVPEEMVDYLRSLGSGNVSRGFFTCASTNPHYMKHKATMDKIESKAKIIGDRAAQSAHKKQATELKRVCDRLYKWHAQGREFELLQNNPDLREVMWPEQYAASIKHACNVNPAASIAGIYRLSDSPEEKQSIVDAIGCPAVTVEFLDYVAGKTEHRIRFGWFPDPLNPEPEI